MIKDNQQIAILRFFPNLFFLSFQVFQVWHLGKTFDKLGSVPTCRCQKKRKVMGHVKHPPQKDSPIFFPKWHPSNGTSRRMVPPVEEFDLPKPRWTKLTKEMASLFFSMGSYIRWFSLREKQLKPLEKGLTLEHVDAGDVTARILDLGQQTYFWDHCGKMGWGRMI